MGLNICKKVLEKIGGGIWLKETHELGSIFCFNIFLWGAMNEAEPEPHLPKIYPLIKPKKISSRRKLKCTDLSSVPEEVFDESIDEEK